MAMTTERGYLLQSMPMALGLHSFTAEADGRYYATPNNDDLDKRNGLSGD